MATNYGRVQAYDTEIRNSGTALQWRYKSGPDVAWKDLVVISSLAGPAGAKGADGADGLPGADGSPGLPGPAGTPGLNAFEVWQSIPGNEDKTITDFFDFLSSGGSTLSGEEILATNSLVKDFSGLTVNQYADLAPGAWVGTMIEFGDVASTVKNNGTYFITED